MSTQNTAPDFGEPWAHTTFRNCIRDRHNTLRQIEDDLRDRSRVCVNSCAGMTNPAAKIAAMREAIDDATKAIRALLYNGHDSVERATAALAKLKLSLND